MKFRDSSGKIYSYEDIPALLEPNVKYEVYVGTDSKVKRADRKVMYATCIILYRKGKGGKILLCKEKKSMPNSLRERLAIEVWKSLETSMELTKHIPNHEIVVHVDVNKSPKYKSGDFCQELVSMVVGQGFKCVVKPDAFAAQSVADRFSKKDQ